MTHIRYGMTMHTNRQTKKTSYYGCLRTIGHTMHGEHPTALRFNGRTTHLDTGFLHDFPDWLRRNLKVDHRPQGQARLTHVHGYTILSFADRSIDERGGSHSTFITYGEHDAETMLALCREEWPTVFNRFDFEVAVVPQLRAEL